MGDFLGTSTSESAYIPETKTDIGAGATFIIVGSCAYVAKKMLLFYFSIRKMGLFRICLPPTSGKN